MIRGMGQLCCEERLRELGLISMEKRRFWVDLIMTFQDLKRACKKDVEGLFTSTCSDRTKGNGSELKESSCRLDIGMKLLRGW